MDWFTPIDLYCERTASGFWNEPLNALSNGAFLLAAPWGYYELRKRGALTPATWLLIVLAASIGVGSFLFHTFANPWSELADIVPIWGFVALFVLTAIHRIGGVAPQKLTTILVIGGAITSAFFLAFTGGTAIGGITHEAAHHSTPSLLNGSQQYAPALVALVMFSWISWRRVPAITPWMVSATLVFAASLSLRTVDLHLCAQLPIGTHFLWHILNGVVIALLFQGLLRSPQPQQN